MLKGKTSKPPEGQPSEPNQPPSFRENPAVNARIDDWIKRNPTDWNYIQSMPPERMARSLALEAVRKEERLQRVLNTAKKTLDQNPELRQAYQKVVANLPPEKQEKAMLDLVARNQGSLKRHAQSV